jgi:hypothetical protein
MLEGDQKKKIELRFLETVTQQSPTESNAPTAFSNHPAVIYAKIKHTTRAYCRSYMVVFKRKFKKLNKSECTRYKYSYNEIFSHENHARSNNS